nr:hypothetical protein [Pseudomonas monteilii]WMM93670.1 hypothetical protein [Pseudomonas monteilii]
MLRCPIALIPFGFGNTARQSSQGKPRSLGLWQDRLALGCTSGQLSQRLHIIGQSCLTIHSSRTRFAARLNSGVSHIMEPHAFI